MTQGESYYFVLVVVAFVTFILVLGTVSWQEQRRRR